MSCAAVKATGSPPAQTIFLGTGLLGGFFALPPIQVFAVASLSALLLLVLPSWLVGVHIVPTQRGNVGILGKPNWALFYTLALPGILAAGARVLRAADAAIQDLTAPSLGVISRRPGVERPYQTALNAEIGSLVGRLLPVCIAVSLVVVLCDTWDLWYGYLTGTWMPSRKIEWDSACRFTAAEQDRFAVPSCGANAAFAILAYAIEGTGIFLGLFWLGGVAVFMYSFWSLLDGPSAAYDFRPIENDPLRRLGLAPMSGLYNGLLTVGVAFQVYAFLHRLQEIGVQREQHWSTYPLKLLEDVAASPSILRFYERDYAFDELTGNSTVLPLIFMGIPLGVACWLPLWKLRSYVNRRKRTLYLEHVRAYDEALQSGNESEATLRKNRMTLLQQGQVWPNGEVAAYAYLFCMVTLIVGAVAPPLTVYLAAGASIGTVVAFVARSITRG
jgi:hypothetical protein